MMDVARRDESGIDKFLDLIADPFQAEVGYFFVFFFFISLVLY